MATRKKSYTLAEGLENVLESDNDYFEPLSSDESSEENDEPCHRVSLNLVNESDTEIVQKCFQKYHMRSNLSY